MSRKLFAGIDIGSLATKCVLVDENERIVASATARSGYDGPKAARKVLEEALSSISRVSCNQNSPCENMTGNETEDYKILYTVSTGYGRSTLEWSNRQITEITCHARGAFHLARETRTIIDIGGQDSKVIRIDETGKVIDFAMNDKCAAGTGRFLEVMAQALELNLENLGELSSKSSKLVTISSMCTVFAESEVISLLTRGVDRADIVRGLHNSIAERVGGLALRTGLHDTIMMTGGVALNSGVVRALEEKLQKKIVVPENPQIAGALGAALLALESFKKINMTVMDKAHHS